MSRFVYLAGPITDCTKGEANNWRAVVSASFNPNIIGISPLRCEPIGTNKRYQLQYDEPKFGTPSAISAKNWFDTVNCDMVLAYMPKEQNDKFPSVGTIIEIGWAIGERRPLIVVTDDDRIGNHPLVANNAGWVLPTLEDAVEVVNGVLGVYARG